MTATALMVAGLGGAALVLSAGTAAASRADDVGAAVGVPTHALSITTSATQSSVVAGDDIDYQVVVTNTGNLALTGVAVTDANVPDCDRSIGPLAPGAASTINCSYATGSGDVGTFSNTASASSNETSTVVSNQVQVTVAAEDFSLSAVKSVDQSSVVSGDDLDYHIAITNDGNRTVTGIAVTDANAPDCAGSVPNLAPGAQTTVDCTYTTDAGDVGTYHNTAIVTSNEADDVVTNQVSTTVVLASNITISQTADQSSVFVTQGIDLHLTVHNASDQTLTGVTIIDRHAPECAGPVADLAPGATIVVDCTHTALSSEVGTYRNTAAVDTDQTPLRTSNQIQVTIQAVNCSAPVTVYLSEGQTPTTGHDVILGTSGPDTIDALGGSDIICAIGGADVIDGGSGNDLIFALNGPDTVNGGSGNDLIDGGDADDVLHGDGGDDQMYGGLGNDTMDGLSGRDTMVGNRDNDTLSGGFGADSIFGNGGNDVVHGDEGNDPNLSGGNGADSIFGDSGNDILVGGAANDTLRAGDGDDQAYGDGGNDSVNGQDDEDVVHGGAGDDVVHGNDGHDIVFGEDNNDHLFGDPGIDRLVGGAGNDHMSGGSGADDCDGASGTDAADSTCEHKSNVP